MDVVAFRGELSLQRALDARVIFDNENQAHLSFPLAPSPCRRVPLPKTSSTSFYQRKGKLAAKPRNDKEVTTAAKREPGELSWLRKAVAITL
jgi:hypothetical protein